MIDFLKFIKKIKEIGSILQVNYGEFIEATLLFNNGINMLKRI
ncbi:hypothetical protein [Clostridium senegalense]|nr:hypothetical protein [Clostridium senegalense]